MVYAIKKIKIYGIKIWTDKAKKLSITPLIRLLCESTWIPKYLLTDFYWSVDKFQNKLSKVQMSNILFFPFLPLYKLQMKTSRLFFFFTPGFYTPQEIICTPLYYPDFCMCLVQIERLFHILKWKHIFLFFIQCSTTFFYTSILLKRLNCKSTKFYTVSFISNNYQRLDYSSVL